MLLWNACIMSCLPADLMCALSRSSVSRCKEISERKRLKAVAARREEVEGRK